MGGHLPPPKFCGTFKMPPWPPFARFSSPSNTQFTCMQGQRRMLDFVVATPQLGEVMDVVAHEGGPWTPHLGLQIAIHS